MNLEERKQHEKEYCKKYYKEYYHKNKERCIGYNKKYLDRKREAIRNQAKEEVFDDVDILMDKLDSKLLSVIVSHGIDLSGIHPNYKEIKEKHLK